MRIFSPSTGSRSSPGSKPPDETGIDLASRHHAGRRRIYTFLSFAAVIVMAILDASSAGTAGWMGSALAASLLALGLLTKATSASGIFKLSAVASAAIAAALALGPLFENNAQTLNLIALWPEILVMIFAGMMLEADRAMRFALSWSDPHQATGPATAMSIAAALTLGGAACLFFFGLLTLTSGEISPATATGFLISAIKGTTPVHRLLILLFFTTLAMILFAAIALQREQNALTYIRRRINDAATNAKTGTGALGSELERFSDCRVTATARQLLGLTSPASVEAYRGLTTEARRFTRALISFMPILGFIGTVIGLATAISALHGVGSGSEGPAAIAASLSGLAVKFETTLLGLGGALIASIFLALVERREAELQIDATRLITAVTSSHGA